MQLFPDSQKAHPKGLRGRLLLRKMGNAHATLDTWAINQITIQEDAKILDLGCGNGNNISRFLAKAPLGLVYGADISKASASISQRKNKKAIKEGKAKVFQSDVLHLDFTVEAFDLISAFCTIRLWSSLNESLARILELLKPNGVLMICDYGRYDVLEMINLLRSIGFSRVENIKEEPNFNLILAYK